MKQYRNTKNGVIITVGDDTNLSGHWELVKNPEKPKKAKK